MFHNRFFIKKKKQSRRSSLLDVRGLLKRNGSLFVTPRTPVIHSYIAKLERVFHPRSFVMRDGYSAVLERKEIHTRGYEDSHTGEKPSLATLAHVRGCVFTHTGAHTHSGDSAICYCSARASILETASTPQPLSWSLQILTTRRRNWRDIWNLGSFQDTHLLLRVGPTLERVGLNSFLVSSLSLVISCRIEHRDFCATWKASLSRSRAVLLSYG